MGTNTLNNRSDGETITEDFFNDIHTAMDGDFVGRGATGIPTAGQNLGTVALPWGTVRADSVVIGGTTVDPDLSAIPPNVIISGAMRSGGRQPFYLDPNGAALSAVIDGTPTSLVYDVGGTSYTLSADLTLSSLTAAPSSNNTTLINDADAADQADTRLWGEYGHKKTLTVDAMGSEITALVGKFAAFSIAGVSTEYFIGYVKSTTEITNCLRGCFLDSSGVPVKRSGFADNDVITLLKLGWVFLQTDATTTDVSYTNPHWGFESPSSPATGDYWYDLGLTTPLWKRYDGAAWQIVNRTLIGVVASTASACVGARCMDFYAAYKPDNNVEVELSTTEIAKVSNIDSYVNVAGKRIYFGKTLAVWNITTDLAGSNESYNATEQASTMYYLYVKDTGDLVMSDYEPWFRPDLFGWYHPHNVWRNIGLAYNNGSSNIIQAGSRDFSGQHSVPLDIQVQMTTVSNFLDTRARYDVVVKRNGASAVFLDDGTSGSRWVVYDPGWYSFTATDQGDNATYSGIFKNVATTFSGDDNTANANKLAQGIRPASSNMTLAALCYLKLGDVVSVQTSTGSGPVATGGNEDYNQVWVTRK